MKVALLIDEFFGAAGTGFGGYGFLARHLIAKYLPCEDIELDVLIGTCRYRPHKEHVDNVDLYWIPGRLNLGERFLRKKDYDVYLSIELVNDFALRKETDKNKKLVLWVQDPRPWSEWRELQTVKCNLENCYYSQPLYDFVHELDKAGRVRWITQAHCLEDPARDLYRLPFDHPFQYLPNGVDIDKDFDVATYPKKDKIIFLGRVESVKRGWIFCEIAKAMPEYEFHVLGQTFREKDKNKESIARYMDIPNLHFEGHVEGERKAQFLKDAKILVNTSIHEAMPVSFLEAMAYGTCIVSCRNPDDYTELFGRYVGKVLGDGYDSVPRFVEAIRGLMQNEDERRAKSLAGRAHAEKYHNVPDVIAQLRQVLRETAGKA